jgi:hypothetical protein
MVTRRTKPIMRLKTNQQSQAPGTISNRRRREKSASAPCSVELVHPPRSVKVPPLVTVKSEQKKIEMGGFTRLGQSTPERWTGGLLATQGSWGSFVRASHIKNRFTERFTSIIGCESASAVGSSFAKKYAKNAN